MLSTLACLVTQIVKEVNGLHLFKPRFKLYLCGTKQIGKRKEVARKKEEATRNRRHIAINMEMPRKNMQ